MEHFAVLFDQLMHLAISLKITDIHIDAQHNMVILRKHKIKVKTFKVEDCRSFYTFIKYKANIYLESFGRLQTGSFQYIIHNTTYYLRFAVLENKAREHGVLRILNVNPIENLDQCGIDLRDVSKIRKMFQESHGLVIFCGKTGAGKSTTLFSGLNELEDKEIFTLENPIEKYIDHLIQIECDDHDLNKHITQLLRHDPDILVIGEIRTTQDLKQAVRAALSGHLLITTLHAGDVDEVLMRLVNLGISNQELITVLKGLVYQKIEIQSQDVQFIFDVRTKENLKDAFYELQNKAE